jgi:hypothetical protein
MAFKFLNSAVVLPKFDIVTVYHLPGAFPCALVVIADEIDGFHEMTVTANKVRPIVGHDRTFPYSGDLSSPSSQPRAPVFMGSVATCASWIWLHLVHRRVQCSNPERAAVMR